MRNIKRQSLIVYRHMLLHIPSFWVLLWNIELDKSVHLVGVDSKEAFFIKHSRYWSKYSFHWHIYNLICNEL